jgi:hypothetical protein
MWDLVLVLLLAALVARAAQAPATQAVAVEERRRFVPPEVPVSFGPEARWIVVRGVNVDRVLDLLPVEDVERCGWRDGLQDAADRDTVFVADVGDEWVLIFSQGLPLPEPEAGSRAFDRLVQGLATSLRREVFFFLAEGDRGRLGWAWVGPEKVVRVVRWERGGVHTSTGEALPAEALAGAHSWGQAPEAAAIYDLATRWTVDVRDLASRGVRGLGWLARWREAVWI